MVSLKLIVRRRTDMNELEAQYNQSSASSLGPQSEINKSGESGDSSQDDFTDESDINDQQKRKKVMITRAPRKKQAVTKTRDRAIIEKIEQNRSMSPLLKFPAELLEKILEYVVGGGLIHVKYITADQLTFLTSSYRSPPKNGVFRSAVCQAEESEHQVYVEANSHDQRGPLGQTLEPYVANWMQRHQNCSGHCANDGSNDGGEEKIANLKLMMKTDRVDKVDLRVMATCRQLYERCNVLLWRTNTFSFDDGITFAKFLESLNPAQKRKFEAINISTHVRLDCGVPYSRTINDNWHQALSPTHLKMLRGLSTVQLCIALHRGHQGGHLVRAHENCEDYVSKSISTIKRLEALPLNKVTVVINDDRQASDSISHPQWTKTEKLAFAETIRANLVADHTAEIQQRTEEVRKVRKQRLAALPSKEKRERAYVRYRKHLVNEAAKKLKAMDDARRVLVNKVEIMVGLAVEHESERQRQIVEGEKYKLRNMKIEETHLWYRYRDLQKRLDEVLKDSSLAKCQPLKRRYLSEDSSSDRKDLGSDTEDSGSGGEES